MVPIIILVVLVVLVLFAVLTYNGLVTKRNRVDEANSQIQVQFQRRHDLIPNLVNAVKGYMDFEKGVLVQVTQARGNARDLGVAGPARVAREHRAVAVVELHQRIGERAAETEARERGAGGALAMADAIEALCRRIESAEGAREIEIIAHSMGAVAALLFLKRYPARRTRLAAISPLFYGVPVDIAPETLAEDEAHRERIAGDTRFPASIPNALATDLDKTAKELLADPSFLEGRKAAFFVGEDDPLVPFALLKETVAALPLKASRFAGFPRERHEITGGKRGDQAVSAILAWLDETRFEQRS